MAVGAFVFACGTTDDAKPDGGDGPGGAGDAPANETAIHEHEFANDKNLFATPGRVVIINLEHPDDVPHPLDTLDAGADQFTLCFDEATPHVFSADLPSEASVRVEIHSPTLRRLAVLRPESEAAHLHVPAECLTLSIFHTRVSKTAHTLFFTPDAAPRPRSAFRVATTSGTKVALDCPGCSLDGKDFSNSNLAGSNLAGAKLRGANLSGTQLTCTGIFGSCTDLRGAQLSKANLDGADAHGANLAGAQLPDASAQGEASGDLAQRNPPERKLSIGPM